jgi:DNA-binding NtrC family response regulator
MNDQKKVLIVDDEIDLCQLLKSYFLRKNYEVVISHSLKEGLHLLSTFKPHIALIDNNFPDGRGWDIVPQLAKEYPDMNIALISAFNMPQSINYGNHFHIIEKPIKLTDLDRYIAEIAAN